MEDISRALNDILGSEEGRKNLQSVASMLGVQLPEDMGASKSAQPSGSAASGIDADTLMKISQLMQRMNRDDKNTQLLRALRPHVHDQKKLDEAIGIMQLLSLLPMLGEYGMFGGNR